MARPLRIEYPGAFYHVISRGNEQKDIFRIDKDRERFLGYLKSATERYGARIHVYCLMSNHYHLLLETPLGNLSRIMLHIGGAYTNYFNAMHGRSGHLFQGRYKAIVVEMDEYAQQLSRYIHLNPVRAGMVDHPEDHPWSSCRYYTKRMKAPQWLYMDFILGFFGRKLGEAKRNYREFMHAPVAEEEERELKKTFAGTVLGTPGFVSRISEKYLDKDRPLSNVPAAQAFFPGPRLDDIIDAVGKLDFSPGLGRQVILHLAHTMTGMKLKTIGQRFGIGESAVAQAGRRLKERIDQDKRLRKKVERIKNELGLSRVKT